MYPCLTLCFELNHSLNISFIVMSILLVSDIVLFTQVIFNSTFIQMFPSFYSTKVFLCVKKLTIFFFLHIYILRRFQRTKICSVCSSLSKGDNTSFLPIASHKCSLHIYIKQTAQPLHTKATFYKIVRLHYLGLQLYNFSTF